VNAFVGEWVIATLFKAPPEVARIGQHLLYFAACFEAFDAIFFVSMGALRGAGDTRWTMWATIIGNYAFFMPLALLTALYFGLGAYGAWGAATVYVMGLSYVVLRRLRSGKWKEDPHFLRQQGGYPGLRCGQIREHAIISHVHGRGHVRPWCTF
jgi:Na+-driven multidrug efflux pump